MGVVEIIPLSGARSPVLDRAVAKPGRPRGSESEARVTKLLWFLRDGVPVRDAARLARVSPERVLLLMDDSAFRQAAVALIDAAQAA